MPKYSKKVFKKKSFKKRSRWGIYKAAGNQLWRDVKFLKQIVNAEKKYYDVTQNVNVSTAGAVYWLSGMSQGTAGNTRLGNSIKCFSILERVQAYINATAPSTLLRVLMFVDQETRGATPAVTDVLQTSSTYSPMNMSNSKRFKVIQDQILQLDQNGIQVVNRKRFIRYNGHVKWDTTGSSAIANAEEGHLFLLLISDQATLTPAVNLTTRLRFYDN